MTHEGKKSKSHVETSTEKDPKKNKDNTEYSQRYAGKEYLAEAVLIAGIPKFLVSTKGQITIHDSIPLLNSKTLKPLEKNAYMNEPYSFDSQEALNQVIENAKKQTLDTLYKKVKSIWKKYIDADDFHLSICAADTIFTYYQDYLGMTHYVFFIGNNTSGKSNNLHVFKWTAYRNMMMSDVTSANIYQLLGNSEEGVGTICEDEADNIDDDRDKMRIYKNGYTTGCPVLRTDTSYGRKQLKFNTYCFKAFAAEKLPDSLKAKGFNQRIIELPCVYGFPQHDISEVVNPAGAEEFNELLRDLHDNRNTLLVFRLLHHGEKVPDISLNIYNREKQLFKPILRVFQDTNTLESLLPVISKYVTDKRQSNANTLHAFLYKLIKRLIENKKALQLSSKEIWDSITSILEGEPVGTQTYHTVEFGQLSQKEITQTLKEIFDAKPSKRHDQGSRQLIFDQEKLDKLGRIYDLEIDIQVVKDSRTHRTHRTLVGLDQHIISDGKASKNDNATSEILSESAKNLVLNDLSDSHNVSDVSNVSEVENGLNPSLLLVHYDAKNKKSQNSLEKQTQHDSYFSMGKHHCKNCKVTGDKFHMQETPCKGSKK